MPNQVILAHLFQTRLKSHSILIIKSELKVFLHNSFRILTNCESCGLIIKNYALALKFKNKSLSVFLSRSLG